MSDVAFSPRELSIFEDGSRARVDVTARSSSTPYSIDTYTNSTPVFSDEYVLAPAYTVESSENIAVQAQNGVLTVKIGNGVTKAIRNKVYVMTPSGGVEEVSFDAAFTGPNGALANTNGAKLTHKLTEDGVYLVEVLYDTGFAAYLGPVMNGKVLPILPNVYDLASKDVSTDVASAQSDMLASINAIRKKRGLSPVALDANLNRLANFKAQDMADNNYVGHVDSQGGYIVDTAKRAGVELQ